MRKKSIIAIAVLVVLATVGMLISQFAFAKDATVYRFTTIGRGNIVSKVSATGTLNAVTTISVGTQVSGQISKLYVDFNDHVKKGQLLAEIDPTLAQQAVADAQANLAKADAQAQQADRDNARNQQLFKDGLIAKADYETTQSNVSVNYADVKSAQIALDKAKQNLAYTNIYSPIDGVIVERDVQAGQTVAASLSAPQLFVIANDLSQMQILAQVSESDIAQIKQGQAVNFTVQALPNKTFKGTVQQVRLQSTTSDNVVNYTVVIAVDNSQGQLLPGMTARVDFITNAAQNVLTVSNAALRFRPATTPTATSNTTATTPQQRGQSRNAGNRSGGSLYYLDASGKVQRANVQTGITDGITTQVSGSDIKEGMKVIAGSLSSTTTQTTAQKSSSSSPFSGGQQQGGGRRGGF
ncbi:MAG TPA: efflux RND transporter periplasmic adaptor subunit [Thermoanaerobaculia bacterium]|nr:efflux RND transporter periplasmic adaptor subunit [Thermoanaerobaculia bacterium]